MQNLKEFKTNNIEDLKIYLKNKGKNHTYYYHYTDIDTVKIINDSGYLMLSNAKNMNDLQEYKMKGKRQEWDKTYLTCFSYGNPENIAMWLMYALPKGKGVQIRLNKNVIKNILSTKDIYISVNNHFQPIKFECKFKIYFNDVIYINETESEYNYKLKRNNEVLDIDKDISNNSALTGFIKNTAWQYENEVRLTIKTEEEILLDKIFVKLPKDFLDNIVIVQSPLFEGTLKDKLKSINFPRVKTEVSKFNNLLNFKIKKED
jgi:hypothetical protein